MLRKEVSCFICIQISIALGLIYWYGHTATSNTSVNNVKLAVGDGDRTIVHGGRHRVDDGRGGYNNPAVDARESRFKSGSLKQRHGLQEEEEEGVERKLKSQLNEAVAFSSSQKRKEESEKKKVQTANSQQQHDHVIVAGAASLCLISYYFPEECISPVRQEILNRAANRRHRRSAASGSDNGVLSPTSSTLPSVDHNDKGAQKQQQQQQRRETGQERYTGKEVEKEFSMRAPDVEVVTFHPKGDNRTESKDSGGIVNKDKLTKEKEKEKEKEGKVFERRLSSSKVVLDTSNEGKLVKLSNNKNSNTSSVDFKWVEYMWSRCPWDKILPFHQKLWEDLGWSAQSWEEENEGEVEGGEKKKRDAVSSVRNGDGVVAKDGPQRSSQNAMSDRQYQHRAAPPNSASKAFSELSMKEQKAAVCLGYTADTW